VIAAGVVGEIRSLLAEGGLSQRKIAQRMGVNRGTVNAIARGKRPEYPSARQAPNGDSTPPSGRPVRCLGCGGLCQMPCLVCHLRAIKQRRRLEGPSSAQRAYRGTARGTLGGRGRA
jgi:hypothetical protein